MQENVSLIKEINSLRKDLKGVKQKERTAELSLKYLASLAPNPTVDGGEGKDGEDDRMRGKTFKITLCLF